MAKARKARTATAAEKFFYARAGWSWDAAKETEQEGRARGAKALAAAERWLSEQPGHTITWERDGNYNPDDYDIPMPAMGWGCIVAANGSQESLWGITFDGDGYPSGNPYARVVVAELAMELMD